MPQRPLKLGAAYHGNRMPRYAVSDMEDMASHGMNLVVHMLSHTDLTRHKNVMRDIVSASVNAGLEVWVDNWGLGGPPGDVSHFLSYYPDAHMQYSDGSVDPVRVCLNNPDFRRFVKQWLDAVAELGAHAVFWDEPHIPEKSGAFACTCPVCRRIYAEHFNCAMPSASEGEEENLRWFRQNTIADFFADVTSYSASLGLHNHVCVMLGDGLGVNLDTLECICDVPDLNGVGSDPYWLGINDCDPYTFVRDGARKTIETADRFGLDHNVWIQAYSTPRGREEEIYDAAMGAYDAGARTILAWGYYGSSSNDYAAENCRAVYDVTNEAFAALRSAERKARINRKRELYGV